MSLSDKIEISLSDSYNNRLKVEDVKEAVNELKEKVSLFENLNGGQMVLRWIDEIFGDKLSGS